MWVSRQFDAAWIAAKRPTDELAAIGDEINLLIRRAWASPAQRAGWEQVRRDALTLFKRDLMARGIELPSSAFYLSQRRIMESQSDRLPTRAAPAPLIDLDMSSEASRFAGARIEDARQRADEPDEADRIAEQLVKAQVGSLQSLIQQMTTGDLAEGSAMDKMAALDDAITKAKADLREGVDGAGDVLAQLYQQRLSTTKDAYATTGQYAAERDRVLTEARAAIAQATARVDAGKGSDPALATTNAAITAGNQLTDEGNDILAEIRSEIRELTNLTRGAPQPRRDFISMLELSRV